MHVARHSVFKQEDEFTSIGIQYGGGLLVGVGAGKLVCGGLIGESEMLGNWLAKIPFKPKAAQFRAPFNHFGIFLH